MKKPDQLTLNGIAEARRDKEQKVLEGLVTEYRKALQTGGDVAGPVEEIICIAFANRAIVINLAAAQEV